MVDASGKNQQVALLDPDSDPALILGPHVKEAASVQHKSYFLIFMQMLVKEHAHLGLVHLSHGRGRDGNLIPVLVGALSSKSIDLVEHIVTEKLVVEDADFGEVGRGEDLGGFVVEALVALGGR